MNYRERLSNLYGEEASQRARSDALRRALAAFRRVSRTIEEEHEALESAQASPFITYMEEHYRGKVALGRLTLPEALTKIQSATWVPSHSYSIGAIIASAAFQLAWAISPRKAMPATYANAGRVFPVSSSPSVISFHVFDLFASSTHLSTFFLNA